MFRPLVDFLAYAARLIALVGMLSTAASADDVVIADFEADSYGQWQVDGEAFGSAPAPGTLPGQMPVTGFEGERLVNSFHGGDRSTGTLTSPPVKITEPFLNFLIGGGGYKGETCIELVVDDRVVRSATGPNTEPAGSEALRWHSWDVAEFDGRQAVIRIVDRRRGGWGHINVDQIVLSDRRIEAEPALYRFTAEHRYLHLPVKTGAPKHRLELLRGGQPVREMDVELAAGAEASLVAAVDLADWQGERLTLDAGEIVGGAEKAFAGVVQSDELPNHQQIYREELRPLFHFTSKIGWLNDPNGLVHDGERWHLFYQHNPYGWNWGNMHWGHAVSDNLVHWKELGDAIYPWSDCQGAAFSGSAVLDHHNTSGFGTETDPPLVAALTDTGAGEVLAFSRDGGCTLTMFDGNPVVRHQGRDPKLVWHAPSSRWVMAVYDEFDERRWIAFYTSPDLKDWEFQSRLEGYFECPDLFPLAIDGDETAVRWVVYGADGKYALGDFDGEVFTPAHEGKHQLWHGNFYAAQSYDNAPDGRRVQIGWGKGIIFPGMPFNQQMVIPVDLSLRSTEDGPRLFAEPVVELNQLRGEPVRLSNHRLSDQPRRLDVDSDGFDVEAEFHINDGSQVEWNIRGEEILFDAADQTLQCGDKTARCEPVGEKLTLRILADRGSIEVFAGGGRVAISHGAILDSDTPAVELTGRAATATSVTVYPMRSVWESR